MRNTCCLLLLVLCLVACSSDDKKASVVPLTYDPAKLLHGWSYETVEYDGTRYQYSHNPDCRRDFIGFRNNTGQLYQFEETHYTNTYCTSNQTNMRWEPVGNHINFYFGTAKVDTFEVITLEDSLFVYAVNRQVDANLKRVVVTAIRYDPFDSYGKNASPDDVPKSQKLKKFPLRLQALVRGAVKTGK